MLTSRIIRETLVKEILNVLSKTYAEDSEVYTKVRGNLLNPKKNPTCDLKLLWLMVTTSK